LLHRDASITPTEKMGQEHACSLARRYRQVPL